MLPVILLLPIIVLICLYCWWKLSPYSKFPIDYWIDLKLIRTVLFGTRSELDRFIFQKFHDLCRRHEPEGLFLLWAPKLALFVVGEEAIKFFTNEPSLIDKPKEYSLFKFMGETAMFVSSGKHFKKLKKIMMPAFFPSVIKKIVPVMNHHAACLVQELDELNGLVTDRMEVILKNNSLRIFLEASMGIKADTEENKIKIQRIITMFFRFLEIAIYRLFCPWLHNDYMLKFFSSGREYLKLKEELDGITEEVLEDIKEGVLSRSNSIKSSEDDSRQKSLGEVLIEQHLKDPSFDMEEVKNQVTGILTGGYDTTSNTLMWCFWLLGHHQDIQQKAYEEVMSVTDGDIDYDDGRNLTYLECILKETLRLYPAAPLFGRISSKDLTFNKYTLPKNTPILILSYLVHRNPEIYSNPEDFIPERFADDESNMKPWAYIPFAEGVRSCIGKHFAMLQMKIVLSHVLRKFKIISTGRPEDDMFAVSIILKPNKPLLMQFIPRE